MQYEVYRRLLEEMQPAPVTIRTFDIDEDQLASGSSGATCSGRAATRRRASRFGLRSIRLTLKRRELLRTQLRALVRAAAPRRPPRDVPVRVGRRGAARSAQRAGRSAPGSRDSAARTAGALRVGVMIEVPSAAFTADLLAAKSDFLTIGTNDLIQCCLAVDRTDERVSHLYEPLHPAILRLLRHVRRAAARRRGAAVGVRGDGVGSCRAAAADRHGPPQFSMTPAAIPRARQVIRELDSRELRGDRRPRAETRQPRRRSSSCSPMR